MVTPRSGATCGLVFMTALALTGAALVVGGVELYRRGVASAAWPAVRGRVLASEVGESRRSSAGVTYYAAIRYAYEVEGRQFESDRVAVDGTVTPDPAPARAFVASYPVGREIEVHYDPADPGHSAVNPGPSLGPLVAVACGLFLLLIAVINVVAILRRSPGRGAERPAGDGDHA